MDLSVLTKPPVKQVLTEYHAHRRAMEFVSLYTDLSLAEDGKVLHPNNSYKWDIIYNMYVYEFPSQSGNMKYMKVFTITGVHIVIKC